MAYPCHAFPREIHDTRRCLGLVYRVGNNAERGDRSIWARIMAGAKRSVEFTRQAFPALGLEEILYKWPVEHKIGLGAVGEQLEACQVTPSSLMR